MSPKNAQKYWRANLALTAFLLAIWAFVSFGCGILFREDLDQYSIGGAPLGFWIAQQGAIYVFVVLIFVYAATMRFLNRYYSQADDISAGTADD